MDTTSKRSTLSALLAMLALLVLAACGGDDTPRPMRVFAAASLTDVIEALADTFRAMPDGGPVAINVGGSSLMARQIAQGAEADLFVSAHPSWTDYLYERGSTLSPALLPASNRLVEVRRPDAPAGMEGIDRMAVADPAHVPAGIYAREALTCEGRWKNVEDRIVPTLDVRAALAAVQTGAVPFAIVYASDALYTPELVARDAVSDRCQPRVRYTAAVVDGSAENDRAGRFLDVLRDTSMADVWRRHGFTYHQQQ